MKDKQRIDLISTEIAGLYATHLTDSMGVCMLKYFLSKLTNEEDRHVLELALNISNGHLQVVKDKFNQEGLPIPISFNEEDIDIDAPPLYTDAFYLFYILNTAQYGMNNYTVTLNHIARPDMRDFFSTCIEECIKLYNLTVDTLQQQGLYVKAPRVETKKEIDFVDNQTFFSGGWFSKKRKLTTREITYIYASLPQNIVGGALITGFAQVAKSKKISDYLFRGRDLSWKKVMDLNSFFTDEYIPIPSTSDSFVRDSTVSPFSDKFMLNHIVLLCAASAGQDGLGLANSFRHDIQSHFSGSIMETGKYAEDGMDILIENNWFEQPPTVVSSRELAKV